MPQPGMPGSQFPGEDAVMREIKDLKRIMQQGTSANTLALSEMGGAQSSIFIDVTKAPFSVVFDALIWTPEIIAANTAGLRAACLTPGFINLPHGLVVTEGDIAIGTHTYVRGRGIGATTHKVRDGAGWDPRGFYFPAGTTEAGLADLTCDGNYQNRVLTGGSGGIYGTTVSVINSTQIVVENVKAVNSVQHGFDATTPYYGSAGDGAIIPNPSEYVWFKNCIADGYGDDGFTSHGSGKLWFINCRAMGTRFALDTSYTNSNGFEIDDYSYDVTLTYCYSTKNAHGFEFKAHGIQSAATNIRVIGCYAERNEVNFSARHFGNHMASHPYSQTAKNLQFIGCTSKHPRRVFFGGVDNPDTDVPDDQTPPGAQYNGLVIGAYRGVTITNFHHIGDPAYDYTGSSPILVHFKAEDITIDGYHIEGHTTGIWDIYCVGGGQPAASITIVNGVHRDSAIGGISCGSASQAIIMNNKFNRTIAGSPNGVGIRAYGNKIVRGNQFITPYNKNYNISETFYDAYDTPLAANVAVPAPV